LKLALILQRSDLAFEWFFYYVHTFIKTGRKCFYWFSGTLSTILQFAVSDVFVCLSLKMAKTNDIINLNQRFKPFFKERNKSGLFIFEGCLMKLWMFFSICHCCICNDGLKTVKHWNNNKFIKIEVSKHCCINCHIIFRLYYKCFCSHLLLYFAQWYKHHLVQCMLYGQYVDSIFNRVFALYQRFMCFPYILLANSTSACHRFLQMHSI